MSVSFNGVESLANGVLTKKMDSKSREYSDFKLLIESKVAVTSKDDRVKIAMLRLKFLMEDYLDSDKKDVSVGKFIKQFIEAAEIKQVHFAKFLSIRPSNLSKILNGERRLSIDLAIILEHVSKIGAEVWLLIQSRNEIYKMKKLKKGELSKYKLKSLIK